MTAITIRVTRTVDGVKIDRSLTVDVEVARDGELLERLIDLAVNERPQLKMSPPYFTVRSYSMGRDLDDDLRRWAHERADMEIPR